VVVELEEIFMELRPLQQVELAVEVQEHQDLQEQGLMEQLILAEELVVVELMMVELVVVDLW
jgi:hypothetical protein|tara:strand:- start:137 stop:322 length:186 start_codon:yes stop_codon:yes gene_type:complete